ncbi:MAG: hypothetical protein WCZ89_08735 [Phycisphaerae bacterium]
MRKIKSKYLVLLVIGILVFILYGVTFPEHFVLFYLKNSLEPKIVPQKYINSAFEYVAGIELPAEAKNVEALFQGGREPGIFVKFTMPQEDVINFLKKMESLGVPVEETLKRETIEDLNASILIVPFSWQREIGTILFDQRFFSYGRFIQYSGALGATSYYILIDDEINTLYVFIHNS